MKGDALQPSPPILFGSPSHNTALSSINSTIKISSFDNWGVDEFAKEEEASLMLWRLFTLHLASVEGFFFLPLLH